MVTWLDEIGLQDVQVNIRLTYSVDGRKSLKFHCVAYDATQEHVLLSGEYPSDSGPETLAGLLLQARRNWDAKNNR